MGNTKHYNTLFLDRDGVLNTQRKNDYVKSVEEFVFIDGTLEALALLSPLFKHIVITTNQRGVGKKVMTEQALHDIHAHMVASITAHGGRIDKIYYSTDTDNDSPNRKPNIGMALQAKQDFPDIDFADSWFAGDSRSDIQFANRAGIKAILIGNKYHPNGLKDLDIHAQYPDLLTFAKHFYQDSTV